MAIYKTFCPYIKSSPDCETNKCVCLWGFKTSIKKENAQKQYQEYSKKYIDREYDRLFGSRDKNEDKESN